MDALPWTTRPNSGIKPNTGSRLTLKFRVVRGTTFHPESAREECCSARSGRSEQLTRGIGRKYCRRMVTPLWTTLDEATGRAKAEVLNGVILGTIPDSCASFSELHDFADANGFGGAFENGFEVEDVEFWNCVQSSLDLG